MDIIQSEYNSVQFGDIQLDERAKLMLKRFCSKPVENISSSCNGCAEIKAAYCFFDNDLVTDYYLWVKKNN